MKITIKKRRASATINGYLTLYDCMDLYSIGWVVEVDGDLF
jgi:hypothetical protein